MKKVFILASLLIGLAGVSYAQQKQSPPPKVDLTNFLPPAKKKSSVHKPQRKVPKKDIPKVDLSNFKPPVYKKEIKNKNN